MATFSIIDFTPAGAFCSAMNAAHESDRDNRVIDQVIVKPAKSASPRHGKRTARGRQPVLP